MPDVLWGLKRVGAATTATATARVKGEFACRRIIAMKNKGLQPSSVIVDTTSHSGLYMIKAGNKSKLIMHCHNNPTAMAVPIANRNIHFTRTYFLK